MQSYDIYKSMTRQAHPYKAHAALLATNIFFAINFTAVKFLVNKKMIEPFGLNLVRVGITVILLWFIFLFKPNKFLISRNDVPRFILCALTGIAINQMLFIKGLSLTYSIHASLLMLTTPILITFIAAWLLKEKLTRFKIAGLLIGITGATILIVSGNHGGTGNDILLGDIMVFINAVSYTFYFILVRPLMKTYNPIMVIRIIFTIGFFMMLPFCWNEFNRIPWHYYETADWAILFLIVICGTFLAYLFNVYGIKKLGASTAGSYIYSQPFFAAVIAMVILGETLTMYKVVAAVCIFTGVYLANKSMTND